MSTALFKKPGVLTAPGQSEFCCTNSRRMVEDAWGKKGNPFEMMWHLEMKVDDRSKIYPVAIDQGPVYVHPNMEHLKLRRISWILFAGVCFVSKVLVRQPGSTLVGFSLLMGRPGLDSDDCWCCFCWQLMVNWWLGILGIPLSSNPQKSKPPGPKPPAQLAIRWSWLKNELQKTG